MPPQLTGTLEADFTPFLEAVGKAEAKLKDFEGDANKVQTSLNRMVDSFSGRKLVQDATLAAEAVNKLGGASVLTEKELAALGAKCKEAADKMKAMGDEVPPNVQKVITAYDKLQQEQDEVNQSASTMYQQYKTVDDVLDVAGVNVNKQVKALGQLKDILNTNVSELSKMQIAGAAVAAFMAGWQIGKQIDEWFGLSNAIQTATESIMGWNKEAKGGAGSVQDTLSRASEIAKRTITDFTEAQQIIRAEIDKTQVAFLRADAPKRAQEMLAGYHAELRKLSTEGLLDDLIRQLEAGGVSQDKLQKLYHISSEALKILTDRLADQKKQQDAVNATSEKFVALQDQLFGRDVIAKAQEYARALGDMGNVSKLMPDQMAAMHQTFIKAAEQMDRLNMSGTGLQKMMIDLAAATTDWSKVNDAVAKMPDPFADILNKRREAYRATLTEQLNLNQGITDSQQYWMHAGEIADAAMKTTAASTKATTQEVNQQKQSVDALAGSFQVVMQTAAQWRDQAARLREDAARMETTTDTRNAGAGSWYGQYIENLRSAADRADRSAAYEDKIANQNTPWARGSAMSITVNAMQGIDGDQLANELVSGMRRRGLSFG